MFYIKNHNSVSNRAEKASARSESWSARSASKHVRVANTSEETETRRTSWRGQRLVTDYNCKLSNSFSDKTRCGWEGGWLWATTLHALGFTLPINSYRWQPFPSQRLLPPSRQRSAFPFNCIICSLPLFSRAFPFSPILSTDFLFPRHVIAFARHRRSLEFF